MRVLIPTILLMFASGLLVGCGGSGDPAVDTGPATATLSPAELQLAMQVLGEMNAERAARVPPLPPLIWHQAAAEAAKAHSLRMESGGFVAHIDPSTLTDPATRASNAGIVHDPLGVTDPHSGNPYVGEIVGKGNAGSRPVLPSTLLGHLVRAPADHAQVVAPQPVPGAGAQPPWTHCGIGLNYTGVLDYWYTVVFLREPR